MKFGRPEAVALRHVSFEDLGLLDEILFNLGFNTPWTLFLVRA